MKMNWNKIVAGVLLTSSVTKQASAINFNNYNPPNLEKTFEVAELGLVNQEFTNVYDKPITPYQLKDLACLRMCEEGLFQAMTACLALTNPLLIIGCEAGAGIGFAACVALCP